MNTSDKDKMVKEILMRSLGQNADFQQALSKSIKDNQEIESKRENMLLLRSIFGGSLTFWQALTILMIAFVALNVWNISYFWALIPFFFPYSVALVIFIFRKIFEKKG